MNTNGINVKSEYGKLKKVLLHRPGKETENIAPSTYKELLFDDSYYLEVAQKEHDEFARVLKKNNIDVVYLEELVTETLQTDINLKKKFIRQFVYEGKIDQQSKLFDILFNYFMSFKTTKEMILKMMAGVRYNEIPGKTLVLSQMSTNELFVLKPMPNLIFTRDPFASIGNGISLHTMHFETRKRETIFAEYIFNYHPEYIGTRQYYTRSRSTSLEGGDIMILTDNVIAVGISQRTEASSIEKLAEKIFIDPDSSIDTIYVIDIPKGRSWMHLDTVFTQIDVNKFAIFSDYKFDIFEIKKDKKGDQKITKLQKEISEIMSKVFKRKDIVMIHCGDGDPLASEREQWNDGSNVLSIAPNTVITYERNYVTNKALRDAKVKVIEIPSSELSRGRGGPRCMAMPLKRDAIKN